jgi:RHS repeat-associated protein
VNYYTVQNDQGVPCEKGVQINANVSINDDGTGCEIVGLGVGGGGPPWLIRNPQHSGTVTITSEINGFCNDPNDCTILDPIHWKAVATLQVKLPPCEDEGGPCGCGSCSADSPAFGSGSANNDNGLDFRLNLGFGGALADGGMLWLNTNAASPLLSQPGTNVLQTFIGAGTEVLLDPSGTLIQQIKANQGLVNVTQVSSYEYRADCYYTGDFGDTQVNGYYPINPGATPFVSWDILNPDAGSSYNRLFITETRGSSQHQFQLTYNPAAFRWDLLLPDSATAQSSWMAAVGGSDPSLTNYYRQILSGSTVVKQSQKTYQYVSGLNRLLLTQQIDGTGSSTNITSYAYYSSDASNAPYTNFLKRVDYPDGSWIYYKYNSSGLVATQWSAYLNNSAPPADREPDPLLDNCKETDFIYTLDSSVDGNLPFNDDPSANPWVARKTLVRIPVGGQMKEVSRTYHTFFNEFYEETMECPTPLSTWDAADNMHTITQTFEVDDGSGDWRKDLPVKVSRPDGTATLYTYSDDGTTTTETAGEPDYWADPSYIVNGTQTVTVRDSLGRIASQTVTAVRNGVADVVLGSQTYSYTDANSDPFDPLGRSYNVKDLAGRVTQYRYSCCAVDYVIDPDNVTTYYIYDDNLKRLLGTRKVIDVEGDTELSLWTTNLLDGANRVLATLRVGTNGTVIIQTKSRYDILGRPVSQTNALGGVTSLTYSSGFSSGYTYVTNVFADGGTRVETRNLDGSLARVDGTAVHPVRYEYGVEEDGSVYRQYTKEIKLHNDGSDSSEWTKTYTDGIGHEYKILYAAASAPYPAAMSFYNTGGQLWKQQDPDGVTTIRLFNSQAEPEYTIVALSSTVLNMDYPTLHDGIFNGTLDTSSLPDRITQVHRSVQAASGGKPDLVQLDTSVWDSGSGSGTLVSRSEQSADGLHTWRTVFGDASLAVVTEITNVLGTGGYRYTTNISPDGSYVTTAYYRGRINSVNRFDTAGTPLGGTVPTYDAQSRQSALTDLRNGTTFYAHNDADLVSSVTTPSPATLGAGPQTTSTSYDLLLRATNVVNPDGTSTTTEFYPSGDIKRQYGARAYPVGYGYDYAGRMTTMTNWADFAGSTGARITTWNYNAYRGWLDSKDYPDATSGNPPGTPGTTGPKYTYTSAGRLRTRVWLRGVGTTNIYDAAGLVLDVNYSDGTPFVANAYDRRGRLATVIQNGTTTTLGYNNAGQQISESYAGGVLDGMSVTNGFDQFLRRTNLVTLQSSTVQTRENMGYDAASRLEWAGDGTGNGAVYSYIANSPLVSQIVFTNNGVIRMTTSKQYDFLNRLAQISSAPSAASPVTFTYEYNSANQRTRRIDADGSYWRYGYDSLGQVISGHRFFSDGTPVAGQQLDYAFDDIGNRTQTKVGGDQTGANQRTASYSVNDLNQYTSRGVPGYVDIMGLAFATNPVTVNGTTAYRHGEYFRQEVSASNASSPVWQSVTVHASGQTDVTGHEFVAQTPEPFTYDLDGNLASDGRWYYGWDAENRLIAMTNKNSSVGPQQVLRFAYDAKSRRTHKQVWGNNTGAGNPTNDLRFVYDGWNLLGELNTSSSPVRTYLWGLDLSGSMQGAGGVGGLLEIVYCGSSTTNCFLAFDGNGNVAALANAADGTSVAQYVYGPFGELLRATGPMARANPIRFSTKYHEDEDDLIYYGYRYCNTTSGRWMTRDPYYELHSRLRMPEGTLISKMDRNLNPLLFVSNVPLAYVDPLGMYIVCGCIPPPFVLLPPWAPPCTALFTGPGFASFGTKLPVTAVGTCGVKKGWSIYTMVCKKCITYTPCTYIATFTCAQAPGRAMGVGTWTGPGSPVFTPIGGLCLP